MSVHVNPETNKSGKCHASSPDKCPLVRDYGKEEAPHFNTAAEANQFIEKKLEKKYSSVPSSKKKDNNIINENKLTVQKPYGERPDHLLNKYEVQDTINATEKKEKFLKKQLEEKEAELKMHDLRIEMTNDPYLRSSLRRSRKDYVSLVDEAKQKYDENEFTLNHYKKLLPEAEKIPVQSNTEIIEELLANIKPYSAS